MWDHSANPFRFKWRPGFHLDFYPQGLCDPAQITLLLCASVSHNDDVSLGNSITEALCKSKNVKCRGTFHAFAPYCLFMGRKTGSDWVDPGLQLWPQIAWCNVSVSQEPSWKTPLVAESEVIGREVWRSGTSVKLWRGLRQWLLGEPALPPSHTPPAPSRPLSVTLWLWSRG